MRIYVDLDNTLVAPVMEEGDPTPVDVLVRPLADWFLEELAARGEVHLLSLGTRAHVVAALERLGEAADVIESITTLEHLEPVMEKVAKALPRWGRVRDEDVFRRVPPIRPPGYVIDDYAPGSGVFFVKAAAVGTDRDRWIKVRPFEPENPDPEGLEEALAELDRRLGR